MIDSEQMCPTCFRFKLSTDMNSVFWTFLGLRWSEAAVIETICSLEKTFGAETIKRTTSCITSCQEMPRYVARARYPQRPSPATFEMWNSWPAKQNLRGWYAVQLAGMRFALGGRNAVSRKLSLVSLWRSLQRLRQQGEETGVAASGSSMSDSCRATVGKGEQLLQRRKERRKGKMFQQEG